MKNPFNKKGFTLIGDIVAISLVIVILFVGLHVYEMISIRLFEQEMRFTAYNLVTSQIEDLIQLAQTQGTDGDDFKKGPWHSATPNVQASVPENYTVTYKVYEGRDWTEDGTGGDVDYLEINAKCAFGVGAQDKQVDVVVHVLK